MAEKEDKDLIGFDPLAWMNDESDSAEVETQAKEQVAEQPVEPIADSPEPVVNEETVIVSDAEASDDHKLTLDATLNIQNVSHLHEQLVEILEKQDKIEIDASAVASIDTATLQLLIVLKQTAVKLHKEIIFDFPSDKFIESAELLGLAEMLEIDQAAAGLF